VNDEVRVAIASAARTGESPVWHPREQVLYYVDIPGHCLHRYDPKSGDLCHWEFDTDVSAVAPRLDGGLLLAMRDGLWRFDSARNQRARLVKAPYDTAKERFNDAKADPQGRFWAGTIYEPRDPALAALYCWEKGKLARRVGNVTNLNGLAWSPNGRTMYWSDTKAHAVYQCDFDPTSGEMSRQRIFKQFALREPEQPLETYGGRPDGAAMDSEGCYWVSMFEGQRVLRLSPQGDILREVHLPVRCPTMPCFGGADLKTLYITTARENRPMRELTEQPYAGCVLALDVDVTGLPANVAL
jgi:sugar lactone lactonase YvrE